MKPNARTFALFGAAAALLLVAIVASARFKGAQASTPTAAAVAPPVAPPTAAPVAAPPVGTPTATSPAPAVPAVPAPAPAAAKTDKPAGRIQIALLLDTSGSMDGLLEQAKSQLWKMVNQLAGATRDGKRPRLELALYEYGNDAIPAEKGYVRQVLPLTEDLDRVSERLFALTTNGGSEYCGKAVETAVRELEWSKAEADLKLVFFAGNEPFDQGPVTPRSAMSAAARKGIVVNPIYCGGEGAEAQGWQQGAALAKGDFMRIDHNQAVVYVEAPQDAEIARLGEEINKTYVAYGAHGYESQQRQAMNDVAQRNLSRGSFVQRSVAKSSTLYNNVSWDLVDAQTKGNLDVNKVAETDLPAEMRGLDAEGRKAYVEKKASERAAIQKRIAELNREREAYVAAKRQEASGEASLDAAMLGSLRGQASKQGYRFE